MTDKGRMCTSWHEDLSTNKAKMMKELVQGQELATQLQVLLQDMPCRDHGSGLSPDELVVMILRSLANSISVLNSSVPAGAGVCQTTQTRPASSRRTAGSYKRRKSPQSWTTVSPTVEDGHSWRKYGQKVILDAKHPRSYFRCTHKTDQDCMATKQVQRTEENPAMYCITYIGHHTCRDSSKPPQIIADSDPWIPQKHGGEYCISSSSASALVKQESMEETPSDITDDFSSLDYFMLNDMINPLDSADGSVFISSDNYGATTAAANASTVYSCTEQATSPSLDMEFVTNSISFDGDFHFSYKNCL